MGTITVAATRPSRVLVFAVDDGLVCVDLDWVEAVYQRGDVRVHAAKDARGVSRGFFVHRGAPAVIIDPREALGLDTLLGPTTRSAFMVLRTGSCLIGLAVDAFVGVRDLDLGAQTPVPSSLLRDGGLSVGHLIELDGKLHALLEPSRIISSLLWEQLAPVLKESQAFSERQQRLVELTAELRREPTVSALRTFARLCRRNGRSRAAATTRAIVKTLQEYEQHTNGSGLVAGDLGGDALLHDLVRLSAARQTGEVQLHVPDDESATIFFDAGRIADATMARQWGRAAFKRILALTEGSYSFAPSDVPVHPQHIDDAALWLLIDTMEQLNEGRRTRHAR